MSDKIKVRKKHSLAIRWSHWVNFPLICLMLISGVMIYWANAAYTPFIPNGFYKAFGLDQNLALGLGIHFFFMWLFAINGFFYFGYLIYSGEWRNLIPRKTSFKDAFLVTLYDLGLRKTKPVQGKFNGGQKIAYTSITLLGFLQIITGLAIYKPVQFQTLTSLLGGYQSARLIHFIFTVLFILFFGVHLMQVIRAGWNNFRSMITGTEKVEND